MKYLAAAALLLLGTTGMATAQEQGEAKPPKPWDTCVSCHGADGNSVNPIWPKLAGQGAPYLAKQLHDFKAGRRSDPLMSGMAMAVPDAAVDEVAEYFASQEVTPGAPVKPELVAQGEKLYTAGNLETGVTACAACHGPAGNGNWPGKYPALHAQHAAYTIKQLQMFREGTRANDPNQMMRDVASKLTEQEIEAVAMYLSTL
ncbi:MAG: c-type cytochrome [Gammaproteobacteria bacterium]|nr:c-type cytochrome [Gammaproteobacteria bacterium]